ncbi:hypothetical protein AX16_005271 [Volvariella volvacea WC 439]|nr:hypothetical protein AX16_005271 [Volvariella volvacea WC 439]
MFFGPPRFQYDYWKTIGPFVMEAQGRIVALTMEHGKLIQNMPIKIDFSGSPLKRLEISDCGELVHEWEPTFGLESLHIINCSLSLRFFSQSLLSLDIRSLTTETPPTAAEFYSMLSHLTSLRQLYLDRALSRLRGGVSRAGMQTHSTINNLLLLPSLISLKISEDVGASCVDMLSRIRSPKLIELDIFVDAERL